MLLHKNQNTSAKTIEFHEVHRRAPKPPLVPKFNSGTRYAKPNVINHLHHQSHNKIRILHKMRTIKSVQNRQKSHQNCSKTKKCVQNHIKIVRDSLLLIVNKLTLPIFGLRWQAKRDTALDASTPKIPHFLDGSFIRQKYDLFSNSTPVLCFEKDLLTFWGNPIFSAKGVLP